MSLCPEHRLSCLADLSALCAKHTLSPTPKDEIWTGTLGLRCCVKRGQMDERNEQTFVHFAVHLSLTHTQHDGRSRSGFVESGSSDASHHHTLAFSNYIDNIAVNKKKSNGVNKNTSVCGRMLQNIEYFFYIYNISTTFQGGDKTLFT